MARSAWSGRFRRGARRSESTPTARRVAVVAGTVAEWESFSDQDWSRRLEDLGRAGSLTGVDTITLHPVGGPSGGAHLVRRHRVGSTTVVVDPCADGRERVVRVVSSWPTDRDLDEESLGRAVCGDLGEPDLVVVAGRPGRLPPALVWELAYAELVFVDRTWTSLGSDDVHRALAEFAERERRFGGVTDEPAPTGRRNAT